MTGDRDRELPGVEPPEFDAPRVAPDDELDRLLRRAHALGDDGDWEGMATHLREAVESYPDDAYLLCWLGVAEREMGMEGVAYERFKRCLAREPKDAHVLATAGNAVAAFDDPAAEGALRTATLLAPDLPLARWMYGAYLAREGMVEDGLAELRAAVELDPEDATIQYELGVALALAGRLDEAVDPLFRATELDPEASWARAVLGLALVEDDRLEEAAGELERAARERPDDAELQLLAALSAGAAGYLDRAWEMLERARHGAEGTDRALVAEVEERLDEGADRTRALLVSQLAPAAFRERLMARP